MRIFLADETTQQFKIDQQGQSIYIYYGDKPIPIKHRENTTTLVELANIAEVLKSMVITHL